jgi:DNA-binding NtrC family response regulator
VNGKRVKAAPLTQGDVVGVGPVLLIVYRAPSQYQVPQDSTFVGRSYALAKVLDAIRKVAPDSKPVLLRGERGVGKELMARAIHAASQRKNFFAVNCGKLSTSLLHSELFGHVRGAFTGADRDRVGAIMKADHGTLFLDEIGDASLDLQASLLRFLQEGEVSALGTDTAKTADVRVISASHQDFDCLLANGRFRYDLFDRLKHWELHMPPLRERVEDIPELAVHFARQFTGKKMLFRRRLMLALLRHPWPGNVRELEPIIKRAVVDANGEELLHLSPAIEQSLSEALRRQRAALQNSRIETPNDKGGVTRPEAYRLVELIREFRGNVRKAAVACGVSRPTFYRWLRDSGIDPDKYRPG